MTDGALPQRAADMAELIEDALVGSGLNRHALDAAIGKTAAGPPIKPLGDSRKIP